MSAFLFVLGVFAATATTDVLSSHYLLGRLGFQEVGFSPFSSRTANTTVKLGLGGVTSYALSRVYEHRPRVAWVLTVVLLAIEAIAVGRNLRFWRAPSGAAPPRPPAPPPLAAPGRPPPLPPPGS